MDMNQKTKIVLAWELHGQGTSNSQIARDPQLNRATVNVWIAAIKALRFAALFGRPPQRAEQTALFPASARSGQAEGVATA